MYNKRFELDILMKKKKLFELQEKLKKIREFSTFYNSLDKEIMDLCDWAHTKLCHDNHIDQCSYYYEEWVHVNKNSTKYRAYQVMKKLREQFTPEQIKFFFLTIEHGWYVFDSE